MFVTRYVDLFTTFYSVYNTIMKLVYIGASAWIVWMLRREKPFVATYEVRAVCRRIVHAGTHAAGGGWCRPRRQWASEEAVAARGGSARSRAALDAIWVCPCAGSLTAYVCYCQLPIHPSIHPSIHPPPPHPLSALRQAALDSFRHVRFAILPCAVLALLFNDARAGKHHTWGHAFFEVRAAGVCVGRAARLLGRLELVPQRVGGCSSEEGTPIGARRAAACMPPLVTVHLPRPRAPASVVSHTHPPTPTSICFVHRCRGPSASTWKPSRSCRS